MHRLDEPAWSLARCTCAVILIAGLGPARAWAQEAVAPDDDERARLHFDAGTSYYAEGAYEQALQEFEQAYRLSPRPGLLFNIATTRERLGMLEEAAEAFERFLEISPNAENRQLLERRIENLRRRALARREGTPEPEPLPEPEPTAPEPAPRSSSGGGGDGLVLGGGIALGIGGAALIAFGVLGGLALAEQSAIEDGCHATRSCTRDDVAGLATYTLAADVTWPIGAAAALAGVVLIALGASASPSEQAGVVLLPLASPDGALAVVAGRLP